MLVFIPQILQSVKVGAQLGIAIIRTVRRWKVLLGNGPSSIASLHWVLAGKAPLNRTTKAPNVGDHGGKPLLLPHLHHLELAIHMHVKGTDCLCCALLLLQ